jgi:hypothetical protein
LKKDGESGNWGGNIVLNSKIIGNNMKGTSKLAFDQVGEKRVEASKIR